MSEDLIAGRKGTFEHGAGWPHEGKRGWKCKVQKMVDAGWCFDPAPVTSGEEDEGDGVTCFYCSLSLDGWEPKDDPLQEHKRRSPDCAFFALGGGVAKKGKGGGKKGGRASSASKASRLSTQSAMSEVPSAADSLGEDATVGVDDSIVSTATTASQATVTGVKKGGKKGSKSKAPAKGAKGRKRAVTMDSQQADDERMYPDLTAHATQQDDSFESVQAQPAEPPKKRGRGRPSKQAVDSSVVEISSMDVAPPKKATRGRKAKAKPEPEPESQAEDVSAQIQEELEHSLDLASQDLDQSTPQVSPAKSTRGTKRTSDGMKKQQQQQEDSDVSAIAVEFPVPPKPAPAKGKGGRKPSKQAQAEESDVEVSQQPQSTQEDVSMSEPEPPAKAPKGKKGATKTAKAPKGRKASSTRSSSRARGSKASRQAEQEAQTDERPEDLDRDEREIEEQLARMAAEQVTQGMADIQTEQEKSGEYEASPSHRHEHHQDKHVHAIEHLEQEMQAEAEQLSQPDENMTTYVQRVTKPSMSSMPGAFSPPPPSDDEEAPSAPQQSENEAAQPSPSGSDKENVPSSALQPKSAAKPQQQPPAPVLSPSKTVRIPLAPSTPNKAPLSPSKRANLSPAKQHLGALTSAAPWLPADLDELLMASPQASPGTLADRFAATAGGLTSPEKGLTVEEWVRWNAGQAEEVLRRKCEGLVGRFEGEGNRAMVCLEGLEVVA